MTPDTITLRPVREDDLALLFELYASTRAAELAMAPWTPEQKHAFVSHQFQAQLAGYREVHPEATHEMIATGGETVGRLYMSRLPDCLHILDITIAPERRNAGIGGVVLRRILEQADHEGKSITIYVESFNPSLNLFERLGFVVAKQDGFLLLLKRTPYHTLER